MSDCRSNRLTCSRIHPKSADYIVISGTCCKPLALIEDVDLHLVVVKLRLADTEFSHLELVDIGIEELLSLHKEVVDIDIHRMALCKS